LTLDRCGAQNYCGGQFWHEDTQTNDPVVQVNLRCSRRWRTVTVKS